MDKCGHCDNCTRPVDTVSHKDVTLEAWQTLKIIQSVHTEGGRQTISGLCDLARGAARGSFEAGGKRKTNKEKHQLDYDAVAGGKVILSKDVRYRSVSLISLFSDMCSLMDCSDAALFTFVVLLSGTDVAGVIGFGRFLGTRNAHRTFAHLTLSRRSVLIHCVHCERVCRTR